MDGDDRLKLAGIMFPIGITISRLCNFLSFLGFNVICILRESFSSIFLWFCVTIMCNFVSVFINAVILFHQQ